jgi:hypothetical protein
MPKIKQPADTKTLAAAVRDGDDIPRLSRELTRIIWPATRRCRLCGARSEVIGYFCPRPRRWCWYGLCRDCAKDPSAPQRVEDIMAADGRF